MIEPILIVGAGPTGLMMAVLCHQYRLPFRLIDKSPEPSIYSKALVMQARTQEVMAQGGLVNNLLKAGKSVQAVTFNLDNKVKFQLVLDKVESPYPYPLMVEQSTTEHILISYLKKHQVKVEREYELVDLHQEPSYVTATIKKLDGAEEKTNYSWVIGCDGAHSTVRQLLNLKFSGSTYEERFFLSDLKVDWSNSSQEVFGYAMDGRLGVLIPLKNGYYRLIGILPPDFVPEYIPQDTTLNQQVLTLNDLQELSRHFIPVPIKLHSPQWIAAFRSHRRIVEKFRVKRVFLAGDAAHIHSPAGGQGMNTGIQDAHNLAWKLWLVMNRKADETLLDTYHQERYPLAQSVLRYTDLAFRNITLRNPILKGIRNIVVSLLLKNKKIRTLLRNAISELSISYQNTKLNVYGDERGLKKKARTGQRAPDMVVANDQSKQISLLSLFDYSSHTLLVFLPEYSVKKKELEKLLSYDWAKIVVVSTLVNKNKVDNVTFLKSGPHQLSDRYGIKNDPALFLIRPDGYIAGRSLMDNDAHLKMIEDYEKLIS